MSAGKEYDFVVTVKKAGQTIFDIVSAFMLLIAISLNMYVWYYVKVLSNKWLVPALLGAAVLVFLYQFFRSKKGDFIPSYGWSLTLCGAAFLLGPLHSFFFAAAYVIASFFERQVKHPLEFGFDKNGIKVNSIPSKNFAWGDVLNVVLKDNMLTIDLKNNRIIQRETEDDVAKGIEKEFNEFCNQCISLKLSE